MVTRRQKRLRDTIPKGSEKYRVESLVRIVTQLSPDEVEALLAISAHGWKRQGLVDAVRRHFGANAGPISSGYARVVIHRLQVKLRDMERSRAIVLAQYAKAEQRIGVGVTHVRVSPLSRAESKRFERFV
jgi:hypothetical protein